MRVVVASVIAFVALSAIHARGPLPEATAGRVASFPEAASGEYAIYRDRSWKEPTWIGFLQYDKNTYGATLVAPDSGARVSILFSTEPLDGKLVLVGQRFISEPGKDDVIHVNYLMRMLPAMYEWRETARASGTPADFAEANRSRLLPPAVRLMRDDASFGGVVSLAYEPEVPVFNLRSLSGRSGAILELARSGKIPAGGDAAFFSFAPRSEPRAGAAFSAKRGLESDVKTIDGVKLRLDEQWSMVADNTFFLGGTAMLVVDTLDLAFLELPRAGLPLSLLKIFGASSPSAWVEPSSTRLSGSAERFTVESLVFDPDGGRMNRDIKTCVVSADGKRCVVASLTVSDDAYVANRAYFDAVVGR